MAVPAPWGGTGTAAGVAGEERTLSAKHLSAGASVGLRGWPWPVDSPQNACEVGGEPAVCGTVPR